MSRCEDCGCRMDYGLCTNCHEEAYIMDVQCADLELDFEFSDGFKETAADQRREAER